MSEGRSPDEELEALGLELRRLPTPRPPEALVARVRRLAHLELAGRADERLSRVVIVALLVFSWTASLFGFVAVRLMSGASFQLLASPTGSTLSWSVVYFAYAWIVGAAVLVVLGFRVRQERSPA